MSSPSFVLDDETIQRVFGHEAAENEDAERLREYYFKTQIFERITADLPLRILVGHKGIGKSALFTVAMQEDREHDILPILIRPDDVVEISSADDEFLKRIRDWKHGLLKIIFKVLPGFSWVDLRLKRLAEGGSADAGHRILPADIGFGAAVACAGGGAED